MSRAAQFRRDHAARSAFRRLEAELDVPLTAGRCDDCIEGRDAVLRTIPADSDGGFGSPEVQRTLCKRCVAELGLGGDGVDVLSCACGGVLELQEPVEGEELPFYDCAAGCSAKALA